MSIGSAEPSANAEPRAHPAVSHRSRLGRTFGAGRSLARRFSPTRLPLWVLPLAVFLTLVGVSFALWQAQLSLEMHERLYFTRRATEWMLTVGVIASVMIAGLVYVTLLQRSRDHEQTRRHLRALESLQAISSAILARIDAAPSSLGNLCDSARQLLGMDRAGIQLLDRDAQRLDLLAYAGDMPHDPPRFYALDEMPLVRGCLESGQVLFAEDVQRLGGPQNSALLAYFRVRAMVLIPLVIEGEQIGLMTVSSSSPRGFTDIDRRLAELLGSQAGVILANSRLHQAQQSAIQKYKALVDQRELLFSSNTAIFNTGDLEESLRRVAELGPTALGVDLCIVALSATIPHNVRIAASTPGVPLRSAAPGTMMHCPAAEQAFKRKTICVFEDAAGEQSLWQLREAFPELGSVAFVPLTGRQGERIGILALVRRQSGPFSAEQLDMARLFSTRATAAIENARLHQKTRRALEEQKKLLQQRDDLWSVNAAVYGAGTLGESLERIVRLAPPALGVDLCAVDLVTGREGELYLAAITDDLGRELIGQSFDIRQLNAGRAIESREPIVVEDARDDAGVPSEFRRRFRIGSIAYLPLIGSDGEILGLLVLVRHAPGAFDLAQIELARVFATRAGSAIENAQLLEQTRRDAATKAMLLRELNHRVKNNLAGIVALLSIGQPEMPPVARRWLDRVTDRVRVMAGAHQLFVGDAESVRLADLVERMLSSLAIARSAGVHMCVELDGVSDVKLRTEQAISLAMTLHELCYNAIVHGLNGAGGSVTLRARHVGKDRIAIHVTDSGRGESGADNAQSDPDQSAETTGIGLELVKGLVSRELHGSFSFGTAPAGGGTVATVEFPLQGVHPRREAP